MVNSFEFLCGQVRSEYNQLDENLLAALIVASVDRRHLVIQAKRTSHVRVTVQYLAEEFLGYKDNHRTLAVHCTADTSWHQLARSILVDNDVGMSGGAAIVNANANVKSNYKVPSFLIIENLDKTSKLVQTMLISTLVERKLVVNRKKYLLPEDFVLVVIGHGRNLVPHLRDYMLLEHVVETNRDDFTDRDVSTTTPKDVSAVKDVSGGGGGGGGTDSKDIDNTSDLRDIYSTDTTQKMATTTTGRAQITIRIPTTSTTKSNLSNLPSIPQPQIPVLSTQSFLASIKGKMAEITISASILRYMQDIVVALRTHRLIRAGVSPRAVKDFHYLVKALSVLHDYDFVTPSIVSISARKLFPLRIQLCQPKDEPSLNYGADIDLISQWMIKWDEELVMEEILTNVPCAM